MPPSFPTSPRSAGAICALGCSRSPASRLTGRTAISRFHMRRGPLVPLPVPPLVMRSAGALFSNSFHEAGYDQD